MKKLKQIFWIQVLIVYVIMLIAIVCYPIILDLPCNGRSIFVYLLIMTVVMSVFISFAKDSIYYLMDKITGNDINNNFK